MLNKRGQGLQVSTVILIILALLVLVIIAIVVTGGFAEFAQKLGIFKSTTLSVDEARLKCQGWCNTESDEFCKVHTDLDFNGDGKDGKEDNSEQYTCSYISPGRQSLNVECSIDCRQVDDNF